MKYEVLKESSFIKRNNSKVSKYTKFVYSIEKLNHGKRIQSKFIINFLRSLISNNSKKTKNIFYYNSNHSEKYSKDWWLI
jgi:hypothetical protein